MSILSQRIANSEFTSFYKLKLWSLSLMTLLTAFHQVDADLKTIEKDFMAAGSKEINPATGRPMILPAGDPFREFNEGIAFNLEKLNGYGCWCYLNENWVMGRGQPRNSVDRLCKIMAQGYECAIIEGKEEGADSCDKPWKQPYVSAIGGSYMSDMWELCKLKNPDNTCSQKACVIEGSFVTELISIMAREELNEFYFHRHGDFSVTDTRACSSETVTRPDLATTTAMTMNIDKVETYAPTMTAPTNLIGGDGNGSNSGNINFDGDIDDEVDGTTRDPWAAINKPRTTVEPLENIRACCGNWPKRTPYMSEYGTRACCGKRTYNTEFLQCCPGRNHLRIRGSCRPGRP